MKIIFFIILYFTIYAQDIHFSQYFMSPLNINPAETGNYESEYRVFLNYRNQWASITVPYITYSISIEKKLFKFSENLNTNLGLLTYNDKAGDGNFSTFQIGPSLNVALKKNLYTFSFGFIPFFNQNSINFSNLYFDNQYNGLYFDPSIDHQEYFLKSKIKFFNINFGMFFLKSFNSEKISFLKVGLAIFNLNKPQKSFFNNEKILLDRRTNFYIETKLFFTNSIRFFPFFLLSNQKVLNEIYVGGLFEINTHSTYLENFIIGLSSRLNDAIIIYSGLEFAYLTIIFSYDINVSPLVQASNMKGGFEIGIRYFLYKNEKPIYIKKHICPELF